MTDGFPAEGMALTHILVSSDPAASRDFYVNVLGAELYREYGSSVVLRFLDNWLLVVEGGGPTKDNPTITFTPPVHPDTVSHAFTIRVPDCRSRCSSPSPRTPRARARRCRAPR